MKNFLLAVTGGIACGKSTAARILEEFGADILDTDDVAHSLQNAKGAGTKEIVKVFSEDVLNLDGSVDRVKLGSLVFENQEALATLNSIMHPLILSEVKLWITKPSQKLFKAVLVPLLFETGFDKLIPFDATFAIVANEETQLKRLCDRGFTESQAKSRIASQLPNAKKVQLADVAIDNSFSLNLLRNNLKNALSKYFLLLEKD